ncbi:similar to Saccharomyces cerevisiae YOR049C RSB1 Suppressor of sphingoid long chain base (LCB) sensitivity of an LCB-lyase mutation [Maudiozyma saulgeensis]|uniref:Sphingoid long-chain base transporter RSB1 n=1 Tax=Maudiozyma saulgeensis TaxID=1789683 RepID=A0A1X7QWS5_9SACH|nr:similar to Saccharomyces cerevisiae YOR049C RSB1 Suppressor of sphingoid long chain base (LCB) sensitivity of an LCB-lyase mutation [Kazachstania saulgeensis]
MTPNLAFNICMIVIWGILLASQIVQVIYKQYWFSTAFVCTGILEVLGYIGRTWSHSDTTLMDPFLLNMICLTIAPVFTMGGIYYQLAKLLEVYGSKFGLWPPIIYSYVFIASDIVSLAIQAAGGGTAGMAVADEESTKNGTHIFVAGLALQVFSMLIFMFLWFHFLYQIFIKTRLQHAKVSKFSWSLLKIPQEEIDYMYAPKYRHMRIPSRIPFKYFTLGMTGAVLTIFTRCVYRLAELSEGWEGNLITHEWYFIILDAVMMSIATICMTVFHPGFAFQGRTEKLPIAKTHKFKKSKKNLKDSTFDRDIEAADLDTNGGHDLANLVGDNNNDDDLDNSSWNNTDSNEKTDTSYAIPVVENNGATASDGSDNSDTKNNNSKQSGLKSKLWPFKK